MTRKLSCNWTALFHFLLFQIVDCQMENPQQLTQLEIDLEKFIMGFRIASCGYHPWNPSMDFGFRATFADKANNFCANLTLCNLKSLNGSIFTHENVVILENYPKWDFTAVKVRFVFIYPVRTVYLTKQFRPLMQKHIMSSIMRNTLSELASKYGWQVLDFERTPRYDPVTEFMNIAILPIILIAIIVMSALAVWSSKFSSRTEGVSWTVQGVSGGKNTAVRRIQKIIDEENLKSSIISTSKRMNQQVQNKDDVLNVVKLHNDYGQTVNDLQSLPPQITASSGRESSLKRLSSRRRTHSTDDRVAQTGMTSDQRNVAYGSDVNRPQSVLRVNDPSSDASRRRRSRPSVNFQRQETPPSHQHINWAPHNVLLQSLQKRQTFSNSP